MNRDNLKECRHCFYFDACSSTPPHCRVLGSGDTTLNYYCKQSVRDMCEDLRGGLPTWTYSSDILAKVLEVMHNVTWFSKDGAYFIVPEGFDGDVDNYVEV